MTTDGVRYWPQEQIYQKGNVWTGNVTGIGGKPGTLRTFELFSIGPDGRAMLDLYRKAAKQITDFTQYDIQHLTNDTEWLMSDGSRLSQEGRDPRSSA